MKIKNNIFFERRQWTGIKIYDIHKLINSDDDKLEMFSKFNFGGRKIVLTSIYLADATEEGWN